MISNEGLMNMRKLLPKDAYKVVKNRKSARLCRLRKKEKTITLAQSYDELREENQHLKRELDELKRVLSEKSEQDASLQE
jgi:hypothetical protein